MATILTALSALLDQLRTFLLLWLPPLLLDCYKKHKQNEIAAMAGLSDAEQAQRYAEVY